MAATMGFAQIAAETFSIKDGRFPGKFPGGYSDLLSPSSLVEEFAEGALPAIAGMYAGKLVYCIMRNSLNLEYNPIAEYGLMTVGVFAGYLTMVQAGIVLHEYWGVTDVKWGPFK